MSAGNAICLKAGEAKIEIDRPGTMDHSTDFRRNLIIEIRFQTKRGFSKVSRNCDYLSSSFDRKVVINRSLSERFYNSGSCIAF